jgi:hypothetical protein
MRPDSTALADTELTRSDFLKPQTHPVRGLAPSRSGRRPSTQPIRRRRLIRPQQPWPSVDPRSQPPVHSPRFRSIAAASCGPRRRLSRTRGRDQRLSRLRSSRWRERDGSAPPALAYRRAARPGKGRASAAWRRRSSRPTRPSKVSLGLAPLNARRRPARGRAETAPPGRPTAVPDELLCHIQAEHAKGKSLHQIARDLNASETPRAHGGAQWWPSTVRAVLSRPSPPATARARAEGS